MKCYTTKTAAEMLNVCSETLRRLCREGAQHRRVGRRILFTESDLAALLESKVMRDEVNPFGRKTKVQEQEAKP
jgi:excisionase family DNA binding protein